MSTILIWMSPEPGHLLPALKIGRDLLLRGHAVVIQVPASLRPEVEELGFQTVPFFENHGADLELRLRGPTRCANAFYDCVRNSFPSETAYLLQFRKEIREASKAVDADIVIIDAALDNYVGLSATRVFDPRRLVRLNAVMPYLSDSWSLGFTPFGVSVILSPLALEIPSRFVKRAHYTEAAMFSEPPSEGSGWKRSPGGQSIVYCSLGTQIERYPNASSIFGYVSEFASRRPDLRVIIHAGHLANKLSLKSDVSVFAEVPQSVLLQDVAVMITHGGLGGIKESIWNQVPMIVIPQAYDQFANAERVVFHNLGMKLNNEEMCVESLDHAVSNLMGNPKVRQSLNEMWNAFQECENHGKTAKLCESLVRPTSQYVQ